MATPRRASVLVLAVALAGCGGGGTPTKHAAAKHPAGATAAATSPAPGSSAPATTTSTTKTTAAKTAAKRAATTSTASTSATRTSTGAASARTTSTQTASTQTTSTDTTSSHTTSTASTPTATTTDAATPRAPSGPAPFARLTRAALGSGPTGFVPAATWRGKTVAWVARTASGIALLCFSQRYVELHLHSGTVDAGTSGWRFGPSVAGSEARRLLAAFNGGFKLSTGSGGFESYGRVAVPLRRGAGSIVTYSDGTTDVGSWRSEVPARGKAAVSVRQNLSLLIDHGVPASNLGCLACWGATLGGVADPARAALGIASDGNLIWAAGEHTTVSALSSALVHARVERAVELDINPEWVAGYLYAHRGGPPAPVTVLNGQTGIPGEFLSPWSRDFFTVVTRP